ncbi:MAG: GPW/gp25 family protein [Zoogloeaceae bacterium]|jgi:phage baseplate assembly protein W|nr:GPW/gp25 family protein [Zoogloeaceae bacterium]
MASLSLIGVSRDNGQPLTGMAHLVQSITDITTTPVGSRVMRPEYGSHLPRMVDLPVNRGLISAMQAEVVRAIGRWEPRLELSRCAVTKIMDGAVTIEVHGRFLGRDAMIEVAI